MADEQEQVLKDRERLMKMAEGLTKNHDLSKSQGPSTMSQNDYRQSMARFTSPFSTHNDSTIGQGRSVHFDNNLNLNSKFNGVPQADPQMESFNARLRFSELGSFGNLPTNNR